MNSISEFKQKIFLIGIFLMSCVDAVFTLMWIKLEIGKEVNPLLEYSLQWGKTYFVSGKILLTLLGSLILFACRRNKIARAASLVLFVVYFFLIVYHCIGSAIILSD